MYVITYVFLPFVHFCFVPQLQMNTGVSQLTHNGFPSYTYGHEEPLLDMVVLLSLPILLYAVGALAPP